MQFGLRLSQQPLGHDLGQADIRGQRWWLWRLEKGRKGLQDRQGADGYRRRFDRTCPSHPHAAHAPL